MKGVIFNIFEDFVVTNFSDATWEKVLEDNHKEDEVFIGPKTYDDADLFSLIFSAIKLTNLEADVVIRCFGKFAFKNLKNKIDISKDFDTPEELLMALDNIIHVEVRKLLEDAHPPKFEVYEENDYIYLKYYSKRNLCILVEGLIEGLATFYGRKVDYQQTTCTHNGDKYCTFKVKFI